MVPSNMVYKEQEFINLISTFSQMTIFATSLLLTSLLLINLLLIFCPLAWMVLLHYLHRGQQS